jgi:heptosyltransferase II
MKILIELPSWLGDSIMATPAIENIINHFENSEIMLVGSRISIEALSVHPKINSSQILKKNYFALYRFAKEVGSFDMFISFKGSIRSKILKFYITSNKKFKFDKNKYINQHQVEKYNSFVNDILHLDSSPGPLVLHHEKIPFKGNKKLLGINPGASYGSAKRWYPEEFAKVALGLSSEFDILIFGSNSEIDIANDIEEFLRLSGIYNFKNLSGSTSISELISQISQLDLFITGDSGPMHIAASFSIPTVSIFGPTRDKETSQWMNKKNITMKKKLACQPCMKRSCPLGHHNCMKLIKSNEVLKAIETI